MNQNWFENWFDSNYYHILYKNRDDREASEFLMRLMEHLEIPLLSRVADIACGKGRHSKVLSDLGYSVWGMDLSANSVAIATSMHLKNATFSEHDMRKPFPENDFAAALNLFTSFGYFSNEQEDLLSIQNMYNCITAGGYFVQDYLNAEPLLNGFPIEERKSIDGVDFDILKHVKDGFIVKDIALTDNEIKLEFQEQVKIYSVEELVKLHEMAGFEIVKILGDYQLNSFNLHESPRIILISKK